MNNIEELIEIIKEYGGEATFLDICNRFQEKFKDSLSQAQRMAIAHTLNEYPNIIYLEPETKKWKIIIPKKVKSDVKHANNNVKLIVCRIAYMNKYNGITDADKPVNGGSYVANTGDAEEKYNFLDVNGECYGFVETKHTKDGVNKKITLEKIDEFYKNKDIANNIKVVFVALNPKTKKTVVIGWYDNADVYRERQYHTINGKEHQYNIKCKLENANLIDDGRRVFEVPNASKEGSEFGIGQANIWYIQNNEKAHNYEMELLQYLENVVI